MTPETDQLTHGTPASQLDTPAARLAALQAAIGGSRRASTTTQPHLTKYMTADTIKAINATRSQDEAKQIAFEACKWHSNSATDRSPNAGYGDMLISEMPDGGVITYDGRGWLARYSR